MSWKLIGSPRSGPATRKVAQEFSSMDPAPHDRGLKERRLQVYERLMREGKFRPVTWGAAYCKQTGGTYRVNGNHTSTLLATLDPMPNLFITVERYECDTLDDVAHLYATFDSGMQSRTASDINQSFAGCVKELAEVSSRIINLAVAGMAYAILGSTGSKNREQPPERAERLLEHPEFVLWLAELLPGSTAQGGPRPGPNKHLKRGAVCAAMFATFQKSMPQATKFWAEVRDETAPTPEEPSRKLAKYLVVNFSAVGASNRKPGWRVADREVYVKCLHAWNAWRKGETTNLNYHPKAALPDVK